MTTPSVRRSGAGPAAGEQAEVTVWRRRRLIEAGFPEVLATGLAAAPGVEVHALLQLVDRGCPPELAARILSPIADGQP